MWWWRVWWSAIKVHARRGRVYDGMAVMACVAAAVTAWWQTHDLEWPCESDLYRDMGAAQSVLDGEMGGDPAYLGERAWYPPLIPALVGLTSRITQTPLHEAYTTSGVYLNLLAPAAFYVMAVRFLGKGAALSALIAFLFLAHLDLVSWLHATYSPWLWACNLAQAFFYLAVWLSSAAFETHNRWLTAAAGIAVGLTMLAHAAPALILFGIVAATVLHDLIAHRGHRARRWRALGTAAAVGGVAALVAAPFYGSLMFAYGARVKNTEPLTWLASELSIEGLPALGARLITLRGIVALVGLVSLAVPKGLVRGRTRCVLLAWPASAGAGMLYGYAIQRVRLPPLMPSWHFYFYLQAFESVAFGLGVAVIARLIALGAGRVMRERWVDLRKVGSRSLDLVLAGLLLVVLARWERYADRPDLRDNRRQSMVYGKFPEMALYRWMLSHAEPSDVVLTEPVQSFYVAAAGRKVISVQRLFANPYVSPDARERDQVAMLRSLAAEEFDAFRHQASRYHVRYVALRSEKKKPAWLAKAPLKLVHRARRRPGFDVYAVSRARISGR